MKRLWFSVSNSTEIRCLDILSTLVLFELEY